MIHSHIKRLLWPVVLGVLFIAAAEGVHKTKITPQLLENTTKLESIANRLSPSERKLFASYVMSRKMSAVIPAVAPAAQDPATVGDAIRIMKTRDAILDEEDKALAPLDAKIASLQTAMVQADYATGPTDAYNAAVAERDKVQTAYHDKLDNVK